MDRLLSERVRALPDALTSLEPPGRVRSLDPGHGATQIVPLHMLPSHRLKIRAHVDGREWQLSTVGGYLSEHLCRLALLTLTLGQCVSVGADLLPTFDDGRGVRFGF